MKRVEYIITILALLTLLGLIACKKYKDPNSQDLGLTNKYCNDPIAANYNHGFPGIPDNDVCVYANEMFDGTWMFQDSVYLPDMTFVSTQLYTLNFIPDQSGLDTLRLKMQVTGLCPTGGLKLTANRYGTALTDTLIEYTDGGQIFCSNTDTVSGMFRIISDSTSSTKMSIQLNVNTSGGSFLHTGYAIKQ